MLSSVARRSGHDPYSERLRWSQSEPVTQLHNRLIPARGCVDRAPKSYHSQVVGTDIDRKAERLCNTTRLLKQVGGIGLGCHNVQSVWRRMVTNYNEANNFAAADTEIVRHDQLAGRKPGFIVITVISGSDYDVAVVIDNLANVEGHPVTDHFRLYPSPDRVDAVDLPAVIVDIGVRRKGRHDRLGVEGIDGLDVVGNDAGKWACHVQLLHVVCGRGVPVRLSWLLLRHKSQQPS